MTRVIRGMVVAGSLAAVCGILAAQATQHRPPDIASTETVTPVLINDDDPDGRTIETRAMVSMRYSVDNPDGELLDPVVRFITVDVIQN